MVLSERVIEVAIAKTWQGDPARPDESARIRLWRVPEGLRVSSDAPDHGDPLPSHPPGRTPELWEHEVLELFIAGADGHYLEIEWGPRGHHLGLLLSAYRQVDAEFAPDHFRFESAGPRVHSEFLLSASHLPLWPWSLNAYAIHGVGESRRYLAAYPVSGPGITEPDFHRLEFFRPAPTGLKPVTR